MGKESYLSTCTVCGKRTFKNRKAARRYARALHPGANLSAYECVGGDGWHFGHLPDTVMRGVKDRRTIHNRTYPPKE